MTTRKPPTPTDAQLDALLVALNGDLRDPEPDGLADEPEPEDPAADLAASGRFLAELGLEPAEDDTFQATGEVVRAFRGAEPPTSFAPRFLLSVPDLAKLESAGTPLAFSDLDAAAREASQATGLPILKVLRLLKAVAAARPATSSSEPLLRAARKKPDDRDG